ncbi:MAG: methyltransferase domain-containing protein [Myxococcota bacterium]
MSHDHSHGHEHDHDHDHAHSHGHTVPWGTDTARWYEPGWSDLLTRSALLAAELSAMDAVVDVSGHRVDALSTASAWVTRGRLIAVVSPDAKAAISAELTDHPAATRIAVQAGTPEQLPTADGAAGIILSLHAAPSWSDPARCIAEMRRVLRPGGRLFIGAAVDDPAPMKALLSDHGLRGVEARRYEDGERQMFLWLARRSWG